ncbi:hypothetical protein [Polymorphum gilvum]|uniref:hypothetical protein n=1 Tax=Polymorphum gilvum TaxID=991904 RepID=UPI0011D24C40|nr:hypothetical protein [Polymorphum gilvum]
MRLRVLVLPEPWAGDRRLAWHALLVDQKHRLALTTDEADPAYLAQAEGFIFRQLAAPWGDLIWGSER